MQRQSCFTMYLKLVEVFLDEGEVLYHCKKNFYKNIINSQLFINFVN